MEPSVRDRRDELYDEYLAVPDHLRAEIIGGILYVSPRPAPRYALAATALGGELFGPFQRGRGGPGGWWIIFEPELHPDYKQPIAPDLAGWRVERMPALPDTAYFTIPHPDDAGPQNKHVALVRETYRLYASALNRAHLGTGGTELANAQRTHRMLATNSGCRRWICDPRVHCPEAQANVPG